MTDTYNAGDNDDNVRTYNEDNFHDIAWGEGLTVIRLFAPWCPLCRESEAEYLQFAKKLGPHAKVGVIGNVK